MTPVFLPQPMLSRKKSFISALNLKTAHFSVEGWSFPQGRPEEGNVTLLPPIQRQSPRVFSFLRCTAYGTFRLLWLPGKLEELCLQSSLLLPEEYDLMHASNACEEREVVFTVSLLLPEAYIVMHASMSWKATELVFTVSFFILLLPESYDVLHASFAWELKEDVITSVQSWWVRSVVKDKVMARDLPLTCDRRDAIMDGLMFDR